MKDVGDFAVVAQEEIRQDLRAMLRGAVGAGLEVLLGGGNLESRWDYRRPPPRWSRLAYRLDKYTVKQSASC